MISTLPKRLSDRARLKAASFLYYHVGKSPLTDGQYDNLFDSVVSLNPNDPMVNTVGSDALLGKKVKLPMPMGSLNKLRPDEVKPWVKKVKAIGHVYAGPKLDGLAGLLHYKGALKGVYKRGNGVTGIDITKLAVHVPGVIVSKKDSWGRETRKAVFAPLSHTDFYVKVEFVCRRSVFEKIAAETDYVNARNFCAGVLNRKDPRANLKYLQSMMAVAVGCEGEGLVTIHGQEADGDKHEPRRTTEQVRVSDLTKDEQLSLLERLGFITLRSPLLWRPEEHKVTEADYKRFYETGIESKAMVEAGKVLRPITCAFLTGDDPKLVEYSSVLKNLIKHYDEKLDVMTDGVVIEPLRRGNRKMGVEANGLNPKWMRAVKLDTADQASVDSGLKTIDWNYTKRAVYKPTGVLAKPAMFNGVEVDRVYLHNYATVKKHRLGPGAVIKVIRSGDVIPYFEALVTPADKIKRPINCRYCEERLSINEVDLYCSNKKCSGLRINQIYHFFESLKLDQVGPGIIDQLFNHGFDTIPKILSIKAKDIQGLDGIGKSRARLIADRMSDALTEIHPTTLLYASGYFADENSSLGYVKLDAIVKALGMKVILGDRDPKPAALLAVHGLGPDAARLFRLGLNDFRKFYRKVEKFVSFAKPPKPKSGKLVGKVFAFTKFRDKALEELIDKHGGTVGGVTRKTTALFAAEDSSKTAQAEKLGVEVVPATKAQKYIKRLVK